MNPKKKKRIDVILEPLKTGPFCPVFKIKYYDDILLYSDQYNNSEII